MASPRRGSTGAPDPAGGGSGQDSGKEMMTSERSRGGADFRAKRVCLDKGERKRTGTTEHAAVQPGRGREVLGSRAPPAAGVAALWRVRLGGPLSQGLRRGLEGADCWGGTFSRPC